MEKNIKCPMYSICCYIDNTLLLNYVQKVCKKFIVSTKIYYDINNKLLLTAHFITECIDGRTCNNYII